MNADERRKQIRSRMSTPNDWAMAFLIPWLVFVAFVLFFVLRDWMTGR